MEVYKSLPYVVQCKGFAKYFETIAAFDNEQVARQYMLDCAKVNPQFVYRMTHINFMEDRANG